MQRIEKFTRNLAVIVIALFASAQLFAVEIFEYRRLADLDKDFEGSQGYSEGYIDYIKSISISAHIVGVHFEEVLDGEELREVILPGGKVAYIKSRSMRRLNDSSRWSIYFLPDKRMIDDYGVAEHHREALEHAMSGDLYITHEGMFSIAGKPYGVGPARDVESDQLVRNSSIKITSVRGDFSVFLRGDRYKLIPLGGAQNDHLLIEVDESKMPRGCGVGSE
ncbi:hypothetical protein [Microbulbifer sp. ALW1]|uniref:hypothetical protein n=1 Tax=Microbulbifer sp. (strain ALW1) TaxID=1516059 RepID=UPI00135AAB87|nr:hypothetical protein [Microbulbifer sp. ALW1]